MNKRMLLALTFMFSISGLLLGQTTLIQGKVRCFNKNNCCLECPWITLISKDSINTNPDKNGDFNLTTSKGEGAFSLTIRTIGAIPVEIYDIPFIDTVTFENIYLYNCTEITPTQYNRITKQLKGKFKSQVEYRKFLSDNFSEMVPVGGPRFYFDCSQTYPDSIINPVDHKKTVKIEPDQKKVIRLRYNDLIK